MSGQKTASASGTSVSDEKRAGDNEEVDPMDLAFDAAPEREATEAEIAALREARADVVAGAALIPHEEVMRRARKHFGVE
jgi:hypothetical protein